LAYSIPFSNFDFFKNTGEGAGEMQYHPDENKDVDGGTAYRMELKSVYSHVRQ
jgi:hypothetical protein